MPDDAWEDSAMKHLIQFVTLILVMFAVGSAQAQPSVGLDTLSLLDARTQAEAGVPKAQLQTALLFARGVPGFPQNPQQAIYWLQEAAFNGLPEAQYWLSAMYRVGWWVPKDPAEAAFWLEHARTGPVNDLSGNGFTQASL